MSDSDVGVLYSISACAFFSSMVIVFVEVSMLIPSVLKVVVAIVLCWVDILMFAYLSVAMTLNTAFR